MDDATEVVLNRADAMLAAWALAYVASREPDALAYDRMVALGSSILDALGVSE